MRDDDPRTIIERREAEIAHQLLETLDLAVADSISDSLLNAITSPMINPPPDPLTPCASCGATRAAHAVPGQPCPRFVELAPPTQSSPIPPFPCDIGSIKIEGVIHINDQPVCPSPPDPSPEIKAYIDRRLANLEHSLQTRVTTMHREFMAATDLTYRRLTQRLTALEKKAASYSFDPRVERAMREKPDYTKWRDDEDNLTDNTRQIPEPKPRVKF